MAWFRKWLANPIATVLLLAVLVGDALTLPRLWEATSVGLLVRQIEDHFRARTTCAHGFVDDLTLFVIRHDGVFRYVDPDSESWDELSAALAAGSPPVAQIYCVENPSQRSGFWAHTTERYFRGIRVIPLTGVWTPVQLTAAREGMFDQTQVPAPVWSSVQEWSDVATEDQQETVILWAGVAHDGFALVVFAALLYSFTGWRAWFAARPWSRAGRRRAQGLCPACGYDLQGIDAELCPECGYRSGGSTMRHEDR